MIPGRDQQQGRGIGADAVEADRLGAGGDERDDEVIEPFELAVEELHAPAELPQRDADRVLGGVTGPGRSAAIASASAAAVSPANRARRSSGPVTISDRAWLIAWVRSLRALRLATISARIASTAPSRPFGAPAARPDCAARAALTAFQPIGLALAVAVLAVRPVDLDDPDAGRGQGPRASPAP